MQGALQPETRTNRLALVARILILGKLALVASIHTPGRRAPIQHSYGQGDRWHYMPRICSSTYSSNQTCFTLGKFLRHGLSNAGRLDQLGILCFCKLLLLTHVQKGLFTRHGRNLLLCSQPASMISADVVKQSFCSMELRFASDALRLPHVQPHRIRVTVLCRAVSRHGHIRYEGFSAFWA